MSPISALRVRQKWLLGSAALNIAAVILFGGAPLDRGLGLTLVFAAGLFNLAVAIACGAHRALSKLRVSSIVLICGVVLLPLLQIVPLPPEIWRALPGRELEVQIFDLLGYGGAWRPFSVAPLDTAYTCLMLVPLAGLYLSGLALGADETDVLMLVILGLVLASLLVGIVQIASGGAMLQLYDTAHQGFLLGFFANRNHMALFLALGILLQAWICRRFVANPAMALMIAGLAAVFLLSAIVATASRSGMIFGVVAAMIAAALFVSRRTRVVRFALPATIGIVALLGVLLSFSGVASRAFERYGDLGNDRRGTIWAVSYEAAKAYFPLGAGFGSFVDVYKKHESLDALASRYANHAHEDYLELVLEGGLPAFVLILLALWVWGRESVAVLRWRPDSASGAGLRSVALLGSAMILLPLLHSLVDYPLRRMALSAMFVLAFAWLARPFVQMRAELARRDGNSANKGGRSVEWRQAHSASL